MTDENDDINHLTCCMCKKVLTSIDKYGNVIVDTHFDVSRSRKTLEINKYNCVEEVIADRNEKMLHYLCEECFLIVLNESASLGKLFYNDDTGGFVY